MRNKAKMDNGKKNSVIYLKGYIIRFCTVPSCTHDNINLCPNSPIRKNKYFVSRDSAKRIVYNIQANVKGIPIIIGHDKTRSSAVGYVLNSVLTKEGVLIDGIIDDVRIVRCFEDQFNIYKREYTDHITFEQYLQNIFSSISLSHHPTTFKVNHVGLVNIPARLGTGVEYKLAPKAGANNRYLSDLVTVENIIAAHKVAFMRSHDRHKRLSVNSKFSYNSCDQFLNASHKKVQVGKDQEKAQSEKDSHSKNRGGKKPN